VSVETSNTLSSYSKLPHNPRVVINLGIRVRVLGAANQLMTELHVSGYGTASEAHSSDFSILRRMHLTYERC
jgi:hypothetical protein